MSAAGATVIPHEGFGAARRGRRIRPRVPGPRLLLGIAVALLMLGVATHTEQVQAAATAACTIGEPAGTTCGESLVRFGYP